MIRFARRTVPAVALLACTGAFAAPDQLDVQLTMANPVVQGDVDVAVDVAVTNTTGHAVKVLKWQLPSKHLQGPLFRIIKEDGTPASYVGPLVKRVAPRAEDYVQIEAGATLNYRVELTGSYELGNGRHTVEYIARGRHGNEAVLASSSPLQLWTQGRSAPAPVTESTDALAASITYTGNCTSSEKTTLVSAVNAATTYATQSNSYLAGTPSGTKRYVKWFGTFSSSRWNTVHTHFTNEENAFKTKPLTLDCSCNDSGTYAYVYPNSPYKIYLCGAFWSAPMTGTDSKGGTLVHEMSHFTVVGGTDDWAYGQTAAANLAKSNPTKAVDNADSHEYFAENNPYLP
ncbi:M35 family metallo-endopeptidase [Ideonella sp.]|uniref:M35 family metallo-endopeptidase n=1 Tax=Ideonella sp. TaxID=1929293 RepID=UPI0035B21E61